MRFTVYAKEGCPYCVKIIKILDTCELSNNVYYLDEDFTISEFVKKFGKDSWFPQTILNGEHIIGGCIETINFLKQNKFV